MTEQETRRPQDEFEPIDLDADLTPADVDMFLRRLHNELYYAQRSLREARIKEIRALKTYSEQKAPLLLEPECPDATRSGVSKAAQEEWIGARIPEPYWAYRGAKVVRQNAQDYAHHLDGQVKVLQSLNSLVRQMYNMDGRYGS
jgi:hypothetical protein